MTNDFKNKQSSGARPPRLSPEEYAAKKKAEKEAIYQLLDNTASEVVQSPEKFKAYLDVQSRMDRYTASYCGRIDRRNYRRYAVLHIRFRCSNLDFCHYGAEKDSDRNEEGREMVSRKPV